MKRLLILLLVLGVMQPVRAQTALTVDMPQIINAGDPVVIHIHAGANTGVNLRLYNGIVRLANTLTTDSVGQTLWEIPKDTVTRAGDSLLLVSAGSETATFRLQVLPGKVQDAELLTTANNLVAYGDAETMLVALLSDTYGNPVQGVIPSISAQFPSGETETLMMSMQGGVGWRWLASMGQPGRIRLTMNAASVTRNLELTQLAAAPASVTLRLTPSCLLNDGRDLVTLRAQVADAYGSPVADTTIVTFEWSQGMGNAQVFDGIASLRVPAPRVNGHYRFTAMSGGVTSAEAELVIQTEACA